jgi:hypothetical protein
MAEQSIYEGNAANVKGSRVSCCCKVVVVVVVVVAVVVGRLQQLESGG